MTGSTSSERYQAALHRLQTCVKVELTLAGYESLAGQAGAVRVRDHPKHMRTGLESAMAGGEALVALLIAKGLITQDEYLDELAHAMETRADEHEVKLRDRFPNLRFG